MTSCSSIVTGLAALMLYRGWLFEPTSGWFGGPWPVWMRVLERLMMLAWLAAVVMASLLIFAKLRAIWGRWIAGACDQASASDDASPSSTR